MALTAFIVSFAVVAAALDIPVGPDEDCRADASEVQSMATTALLQGISKVQVGDLDAADADFQEGAGQQLIVGLVAQLEAKDAEISSLLTKLRSKDEAIAELRKENQQLKSMHTVNMDENPPAVVTGPASRDDGKKASAPEVSGLSAKAAAGPSDGLDGSEEVLEPTVGIHSDANLLTHVDSVVSLAETNSSAGFWKKWRCCMTFNSAGLGDNTRTALEMWFTWDKAWSCGSSWIELSTSNCENHGCPYSGSSCAYPKAKLFAVQGVNDLGFQSYSTEGHLNQGPVCNEVTWSNWHVDPVTGDPVNM